MIVMPISLIFFENCKMNSSCRTPNVYTDTHWALFFESFENGMCILIHTASAIDHQPLCPLSADLSGDFKFCQFKLHFCLERGATAGGASTIATRGGDGSASIAQMYICALAGEHPLTPMPPAGGRSAVADREQSAAGLLVTHDFHKARLLLIVLPRN